MRRLHVLVEGQTEEIVVNNVIAPHLAHKGWEVSVSILATKRPAGGGKVRGGVSSWEKIRRDVGRLLPNFDAVTTVIDYYGFPDDAPGMATRPRKAGAIDRVRHVERALAMCVDNQRFIPHLTLHETEAWVFAAVDELVDLLDDPPLGTDLRGIADGAGGPELINDHPATAPSRRIVERCPAYQKTFHGPLCIEALGLTELRAQCPHLDSWLSELERRTT